VVEIRLDCDADTVLLRVQSVGRDRLPHGTAPLLS
jgi:phosphoribosyl-AMP cyclohydrolase